MKRYTLIRDNICEDFRDLELYLNLSNGEALMVYESLGYVSVIYRNGSYCEAHTKDEFYEAAFKGGRFGIYLGRLNNLPAGMNVCPGDCELFF